LIWCNRSWKVENGDAPGLPGVPAPFDIRFQLAYGRDVSLRGKKLGLLISAPPDHPNFAHGVRLAEVALAQGADVYLYCLDQAVAALGNPHLQKLKNDGLKLFACAYGAQRRNLPMGEQAIFGGLTILSDVIGSVDRFVSFN
jgi:predicted peroxiredoxin